MRFVGYTVKKNTGNAMADRDHPFSSGVIPRVGDCQARQDTHLFPFPRCPGAFDLYSAFAPTGPLPKTAPLPLLRGGYLTPVHRIPMDIEAFS